MDENRVRADDGREGSASSSHAQVQRGERRNIVAPGICARRKGMITQLSLSLFRLSDKKETGCLSVAGEEGCGVVDDDRGRDEIIGEYGECGERLTHSLLSLCCSLLSYLFVCFFSSLLSLHALSLKHFCC